MQDPAASTAADKTLLDTCEVAMRCFERLNCAAGSVTVPSVPSVSLQGFQLALQHAIQKLQAPFRGTLATCGPALEGGALSSVSLQRVEGQIQCWKDLENLLSTLPRTKGAGIGFVKEGRLLLPTDASGRPKDKWLGGKVEPMETWWQGALREVDEETFVRSDPWVNRAFRTSKPDERQLLVEGETLAWQPMRTAPLGSVQVARSQGLQLERDVERPCSVARMSTRDVLREAFDALDDETRRSVVRGMRIALEVNGEKTYRTVFVPLDAWQGQGRMTSIANIPERFKMHAKTIEACSARCFADVFSEEPLDVDWTAMQNWEEDGFSWVAFSDVGPRIGNVLNEFNR
jgi:ADP-ribose pyrophosphatase YjhB (NUDIX family)